MRAWKRCGLAYGAAMRISLKTGATAGDVLSKKIQENPSAVRPTRGMNI
jgi:hypothetical protein